MSPAAIAQLAGRIHAPARVVQVVRHVPSACRLRLAVPGLLKDELQARRIEQRLQALPGVVTATADARTGRVLIQYANQSGPAAAEQVRAFIEAVNRPDGGFAPSAVARPTAPAAVITRLPLPASGRAAGPLWDHLPVDEVLRRLDSGPAGLSPAVAARRLVESGPNLVEPLPERTRLRLLLDQLNNLPAVLLLGSAGVSLVMGNLVEAGAIVVVVAANAAIGYTIERRQESLLAHWQRLEAGETSVIRGGALVTVSASELVPGDVLACRAGDLVPADARVIEAHRLACDEASLTGESEPRDKSVEPVSADAPLAEHSCLLHAGTSVVKGRGRAVVVATGQATQLAHVRALVETSTSPPTPLERQLGSIGRRASAVSLGAAGVAACAGLLHGQAAPQLLRNAVALAVAAIPEGLPLVATATLIRTMRRMRDDGMIVRRVASAEALGSVNVLCTDKTGTLTENEMCVESLELDVEVGSRPAGTLRAVPSRVLEDPVTLALAVGILNSDIDYHEGNGNGGELSGSSTERALVRVAQAAGLDARELRHRYPRRVLHERAEDRQYTTSLHHTPEGERLTLVKGAPEQVLAMCQAGFDGSALDDEQRARWRARNEALAADGLRVLGLAFARGPGGDGGREPPAYRLGGLVALRDPLRPGAAAAIRAARAAGILPLMLTGDQRSTARAIAAQVGLSGEVIDGADLVPALAAGDPAAHARLAGIAVLSRVTPADKLEVVRALRARGDVVAMVGDGINDAPALKVADIGIAVGKRATDLTRHTADLVLESEELGGILTAISEARLAQDNLRRSMRFLLATNLSEVGLMVGASLFGVTPLRPLQLLWVNLLTDTVPALALALAPRDSRVLGRPSNGEGHGLFGPRSWSRIGRDAALMAAGGATGFVLGGPDAAFGTLIGAQLGYAFLQRAPEARLRGPGAGVGLAVAGSLAMQVAALTLPPLRSLLGLAGSGLRAVAGTAIGFSVPALLQALPAQRSRARAPGASRPNRLSIVLTN